jgi:agmatine/peptidylarginine deiminase
MPSLSKRIDHSFKNWFALITLDYHAKSDIILDGGNVVDNAAGTCAIVTDCILRDNSTLTISTVKDKLKQLLDVNEVAIIQELPQDMPMV